jgi:hypothetical protein
MGSDRDYPLSAFREGLESIFGWSLTIAGMVWLGVFLGCWIESGDVPNFETVGSIVGMSLITWCLLLPPLLADAATLLIWGVPLLLNLESLRLRIGGAVVVLLVWMAIGGMAGALFG